MIRRLLAWLVLAALLAGCGRAQPGSPAATVTVRPGQPFRLGVAQRAQLDDLSLVFLGVREDSRCPRNVVCAWGGQVVIMLDAQPSGQPQSVIELTLGGAPIEELSRTTIGAYMVELQQVEPYPEEPGSIEPGDYVATLLIQ